MLTDKEIADFCKQTATLILLNKYEEVYQLITDNAQDDYNKNHLKKDNDHMVKVLLLDKNTLRVSKQKYDCDELGVVIGNNDGISADCSVFIEGIEFEPMIDADGYPVEDVDGSHISSGIRSNYSNFYRMDFSLKNIDGNLFIEEINIDK